MSLKDLVAKSELCTDSSPTHGMGTVWQFSVYESVRCDTVGEKRVITLFSCQPCINQYCGLQFILYRVCLTLLCRDSG